MSTSKALCWSSCGSGNEGSKEANGEGVRESVCHDGVKQLAAAVNRAGLSASFNCRRDDEVGDAGGGGAGGKGEGRVEDDEGRLGARGNGLGGAVGGADGDSLHGGPRHHQITSSPRVQPPNHFFV